jgi:hypothetical protein
MGKKILSFVVGMLAGIGTLALVAFVFVSLFMNIKSK